MYKSKSCHFNRIKFSFSASHAEITSLLVRIRDEMEGSKLVNMYMGELI